jgi:hypothetical protein
MKFGNIVEQLYGAKFAAGIQAAFLSTKAVYVRKNGKKKNIFVTVEPVDSQNNYATASTQPVSLTAGLQVFTIILDGQDFNPKTCPPMEGDIIEVTIDGQKVKRFVTNNPSGRCWNYVDGRHKIWITTTTHAKK